MEQTKERRRKTVRMTDQEYRGFERLVKNCGTRIDAAELLEVHINTIDRLLLTKRGSPTTIAKVRQALAA